MPVPHIANHRNISNILNIYQSLIRKQTTEIRMFFCFVYACKIQFYLGFICIFTFL